ncbi:Probable serine/threonine-protein kinase PBL7 [Linum perenne]
MSSSPIRPFGNPQQNNNHHGSSSSSSLSSNSVLIIAVSAISIGLILVLFLAILLLRRLRGCCSVPNKNIGQHMITVLPHGCHNSNSSNNNRSSAMFIPPHSTPLHFGSSPADVRGGGCLMTSSSALSTPGRVKQRSHTAAAVQVFTYRELESATDRFSESNVIGNGGYGVVYRGILSDGTVAAIKMLHREGKQAERAFRIEVDLLSRLHSSYLVELVGYCADQNHRLLIFEFMPNGTLQQHLHHPKQYQPLDWATRLRIALDCARALEFLHEHAVPAVIHRDFKCSNILLDQNFRAKVSDFGLAKTGSDKINGQVSTRVLGTTGYLAPEGKLTTKSDVYSYGVVLLQLLTGRIPVDIKRPPGEHVLVSWALPRLTSREKVGEMVDPALEGQYSKKDLVQVAAIAAMCVQPEADYRPLMTDVVQSLIPLVKNLSTSSASSVSSSARFQNQISPREGSMMCKKNDMSHRALLLC